jgi:hypothetical protein
MDVYQECCCRLETATSSCVFMIDSATTTNTTNINRHKEDRDALLVRCNGGIGLYSIVYYSIELYIIVLNRIELNRIELN